MKKVKIFLIVFYFSIFSNSHSQSGWFQLPSGTTNHLRSVYFTSSSTGYIVGDTGLILKTTNGGINWSSQMSNTDNSLLSVHFVTSNTGYSVGYYGTVLKTTNGGLNWNIKWNQGGTFYSVHFPNINDGYIAHGFSHFFGAVYKTSNGGNNWNYQIVGPEPVYSVFFTDSNTGYLAGGEDPYGAAILHTTDSGNNWFIQHSASFTILNSIYFISLNLTIGYAVGEFGKILKTTSGGYTWNEQSSGTYKSLRSVVFTDLNSGYAVGAEGIILKTTNSGSNWLVQNSGTNEYLTSVFFTDSNTGYAVGSYGTIIKTINGGNFIPEQYSLLQNYPNPFNPTTSIPYDIKSVSKVRMIIYDILGKQVAELVNDKQSSGRYEVRFDGSFLPSGVYFYTLITMPEGRQAESFKETKKMLMIK